VANTFWLAPTANFVQTTISGAITTGATTITLASATNLQGPGYAIIDRTDANGTSTPGAREVITFTGVSGGQLTGVVRAADGGTARSHADGAVIETILTVGMWNSLTTIAQVALDTNGLLNAIISPVSVAVLQSNVLYTSVASVGIANIGSRLDVSAASVTGLGIYPVWKTFGSYSGPTTLIGGILTMPRAGTLQWISILTRFVASGTSIGFDMQKNGVSIFANATTRPAIGAGGTYVSIASIATQNLAQGDRLSVSVDSMLAGAGLITDLTIQGGTG